MVESFDHVLLTRFNVPSKGYESLVRASDSWLEKRVGLFMKFCLPSVRQQINQDFKWIIYFDPASPKWFIRTIEELNYDNVFIAIFRAEVTRDNLLDDIRSSIDSPRRYLMTTNLDNDDSLACDFTASIREVCGTDRRTAVYFVNGLIRAGDALYRYSDKNNAFCSVISPWAAPVTCWADWHNRLHLSMPVTRIKGSVAWLQVVHGSNVSNRIHGKRVSPRSFREWFPRILDDMEEPSSGILARDVLLSGPGRIIRESARAASKSLITMLGGPEGPDKFRAWVLRHGGLAMTYAKRKEAQNER